MRLKYATASEKLRDIDQPPKPDELYDKDVIMKYWNTRGQGGDPFRVKFPAEQWVKLTEQERLNLLHLKLFKKFNWVTETNRHGPGLTIGELAL